MCEPTGSQLKRPWPLEGGRSCTLWRMTDEIGMKTAYRRCFASGAAEVKTLKIQRPMAILHLTATGARCRPSKARQPALREQAQADECSMGDNMDLDLEHRIRTDGESRGELTRRQKRLAEFDRLSLRDSSAIEHFHRALLDHAGRFLALAQRRILSAI